MALAFLLFALSQAASAAPSLRGSEAEQPLKAPDAPAPAVVVDGPETVFDPANHSVNVENLISCRYGVRCHGAQLSAKGVKSCNGTLVCRTEGGVADPQADASFVQMQDLANTTVAVANLLVCRYGSYCRGGWSWYGGRRECRGGVVCRPGPYYLDSLDTDTNAGEQQAVSAEAGPGSEQQAGGVPSNITTMQTEDETDLISCRYGSYCRGGWGWYGGRRVCHGGVVCRPGPYYRHGGRVYEATSVEHPREHPREHPEALGNGAGGGVQAGSEAASIPSEDPAARAEAAQASEDAASAATAQASEDQAAQASEDAAAQHQMPQMEQPPITHITP